MKDKIINILTEIRPEFDFKENLNFIENGMLDSFDIVLLVSILEETFSIIIDGLDVNPSNFYSINSIIELINKNNKQ